MRLELFTIYRVSYQLDSNNARVKGEKNWEESQRPSDRRRSVVVRTRVIGYS